MPKLNEISRRDLVGLKGRSRVIWAQCSVCRSEKWFMLNLYRKRSGEVVCVSCHGKQLQPIGAHAKKPGLSIRQLRDGNHQWKGGKSMHKSGYVILTISRGDPLNPVGHRQMFEHRFVMAQSLGRPLKRSEYVHHRNGIRDDNRLENLELWVVSQPKGQREHERHCRGCNCFDEK